MPTPGLGQKYCGDKNFRSAVRCSHKKECSRSDIFKSGQCYADCGSDDNICNSYNRIFGGFEFTKLILNSRENCIDFCVSMGYQYAGVQNGNECFCGNNLPSSSNKRPMTECNRVCRGNNKEFCGGWWRMNVFRNNGTE